MHVNLLPASFLRTLTIRRLAWRWAFAVALTLLFCAGILTVQYLAVLAAQNEQSRTAFQSRELRAMRDQTEHLEAEIKTSEEAIRSLENARPEDRTLTLLGIASTSAKKASGKVHLKQLTTQLATTTARPPSVQSPGVPNGKPVEVSAASAANNDLMLEGVADNAAAIASLVEALRETGVFQRVDLTSTAEAAGASGAARQFRIDCRF